MTLIYHCEPAKDSSGNYYLPAGTTTLSSTVTYRQSVSICILSSCLVTYLQLQYCVNNVLFSVVSNLCFRALKLSVGGSRLFRGDGVVYNLL